jgi:hypothetical protein
MGHSIVEHHQDRIYHVDKRFWIAVSIALCSGLATLLLLLGTPLVDLLQQVGKYNLIAYLLSCLVFVGVFIPLYRKLPLKESAPRTLRPLRAVLLLVSVYLLFWFVQLIVFLNAPDEFASDAGDLPWHNMPFVFVFIVFCICTVLAFGLLAYELKWREAEKPRLIRYLQQGTFFAALAVLAVLAFLMMFYGLDTDLSPFTDGDPYGCIYNLDAVINSIMNVADGVAYGASNLCIYGHYALFFLPLSWFMDLGPFEIGVAMAALNMVAFLCLVIAAYRLSRSRLLCVLAAAAYFFCGLAFGPYYQNFPLRVLFPALLLLYGSCVLGRERLAKGCALGGYLIAALGIVCNLETGVFCAIAWGVAMVFADLPSKFPRALSLYIKPAFDIVMIPLSLCAAWILTALCNCLLLGGDFLSLQSFLFPMLNGSFLDTVVQHTLSIETSIWWLVFVLFLATAAHTVVVRFSSGGREAQVAARLPFLCAVLGLLQLAYFINRSAIGNMNIAYPEALLCLLYWARIFIVRAKRGEGLTSGRVLSLAGSLCALSFLLMASWQALEFLPGQIADRLDERSSALEQEQTMLDEIRANVPANTRAFGSWISELYTQLGWDGYIASIDYSDITLDSATIDRVEEMLDDERTPFVTSISALVDDGVVPSSLQDFIDERYVVQYSWSYDGLVFVYYVPR